MTNETCQRGFTAPIAVLNTLHDNQAKEARHQCPICAYNKGVEEGIRRAMVSLQSLSDEVAGR